jgi:NADH-quinone oxidoreductase subunit G
MSSTIIVDKQTVELKDEKNLLEVIRKAGIELPTFCYHTHLSAFGACRMCVVEVEGRGVVPACSIKADPGMVVSTNTKKIRNIRKMIIELMLANHDHNCTVCDKSGNCRLQSIAQQLGIRDVRFKKTDVVDTRDLSSLSVARDSNKCVLCGDCVRQCSEVQKVGALDFAYRGANSKVLTSFNRGIAGVECVNCGQCIKVCPVGALTVKTNITDVWNAINDKGKTVVAQIAPAVRVALGEYFGKQSGENVIGKAITALRLMGFDKVYDTCNAADYTVVEEGKEFLARYEKGERLPLFTSCCPAWVKYAEQYQPDLLNNLSTAKSPQAMFGSLAKNQLTMDMGIKREDLVVVGVMPCTAKKYEAARDEFKVNGNPDVDYVITTEELAKMMKEQGLIFDKLANGQFDNPFGVATGGAIIFGSSGGVCEAVLRFAADTLDKGSSRDFVEVRGDKGVKACELDVGGKKLRMAVVSGLANAKAVIEKVKSGEEKYDIIEVMACPGGCVNGGGQPIQYNNNVNDERAKGLYDNDKGLDLRISSENPDLQKAYRDILNAQKAHELLHTVGYDAKPLINADSFQIYEIEGEAKRKLSICFGPTCMKLGAQDLFLKVMGYLREKGLLETTEFTGCFCGTVPEDGLVMEVNGEEITNCTLEKVVAKINK